MADEQTPPTTEAESENAHDVSTHDADEEFQFTDAQTEDVYGSAADEQKTSGISSQLNRRNLLILVGVVVIAFAFYKLLEVFYLDRGIEPAQTPPKTAVPAAPVVKSPPPSTPKPTVTQLPRENLQQTRFNQSVQQKLGDYEQTTARNQRNIQILAQQMNGMNSKINNLQQGMQNINQKLNAITDLLKVQSAELRVLKQKTRPKPKVSRVKRPRYTRPVLYVKALIPNRAWLVDPDGQTFTVSVGDSIPYYGRIRRISVVQGSVTTSSGAIIYFKDQ
ncbi:MAG: hypothetical protein AAGG80_00305 [Pseudomonadota bacterium]